MPDSRRPAVKVVVFQCPCGMGARHRSPHGARPRSRAIFVDAAVSSMKMSLSGSRSSWPSNQAMRRRKTSGRCCSEACAVFFWPSFFERDAAPVKKQPDRRGRHPHAALASKALADLSKSDVRCLLDEARNEGRVRIKLRARRLSLLARFHLAGLAIAAIPGPGRRDADAEASCRLPRRNPIFDRCNYPTAKVSAQAHRLRLLVIISSWQITGAVKQTLFIA